jgi:hypothetical protein
VDVTDERWPVRVVTSARRGADLRGAALLLVVTSPLWWLPGGFSRFVLLTLLATALGVVVAAAARPAGALPRPLVLVGAVWAVCFAVAGLLGDTPVASLAGRWPRYEGLPVLATYAGACWVGARVTGRGDDAMRRLHGALVALAVVLAGFSVLDVVGVTPLGPGTEDRSGSVLGNATDQGAVAMMTALVLAGAVLRCLLAGRPWRGVAVETAGLVASLVTVAVSGSRTALGLTVLGLGVLVVLRPRAERRQAGRALAAGAAATVLLGLVAVLVPTTRDRLLGLGTAEGRLHQWRLTLDLVLDHPLLGLGGSRYVDAFLGYEDAAFVDFTGPQRLADSPHSVLLQVLVAGGLVLLGVTLVGLYVVARRVRAVLREHPEVAPVVVAVAAYLALACVNFTTAGTTCLAALLVGVVVAVPVSVPMSGRDRPPAAWGVGVPAVVVALLLTAAAVGEVRLQQAVDAADRRDVPRSGALLDETARWRPWDVDVAVIGARVLAGETARGTAGGAAQAERWARDALERAPESYEALVALGVALSAQGRVTEAATVLDRAVALAPQRPDGWVQRAIARAGLGRLDDALADLDRAAAITPRSPVVRRLQRQVRAAASAGAGG